MQLVQIHEPGCITMVRNGSFQLIPPMSHGQCACQDLSKALDEDPCPFEAEEVLALMRIAHFATQSGNFFHRFCEGEGHGHVVEKSSGHIQEKQAPTIYECLCYSYQYVLALILLVLLLPLVALVLLMLLVLSPVLVLLFTGTMTSACTVTTSIIILTTRTCKLYPFLYSRYKVYMKLIDASGQVQYLLTLESHFFGQVQYLAMLEYILYSCGRCTTIELSHFQF